MPVYVDEIDYLKTVAKRVALPKGKPNKFGSVIFLMSKDFKSSVNMINNRLVYNDNKYFYYYYDMLYNGKIYNKRYRIRDLDVRAENYKKISTLTNVSPHPFKPVNTNGFKNTYFDMYKYLEIYNSIMTNAPLTKKVTIFWSYIQGIFKMADGYDYKGVMIDANLYPMKKEKNLTKMLDNPIFLLYYTSYRYFDLVKDLNIDFIIYSTKSVLKINFSKCDEKDYTIIKRELGKLTSTTITDIDEKKIDEKYIKEKISSNLKEKYNFVGDQSDDTITDTKQVVAKNTPTEEDDKLSKLIEDKVEEGYEKGIEQADSMEITLDAEDMEGFATNNTVDAINEDKELIDAMYSKISSEKITTKPISSARDKMLREKQKDIKVKNMTINDLSKIKSTTVKIEKRDVGHKMVTINDNMKEVKFANFEKTYNEKLMTSDLTSCFTMLNDKSIGMSVVSIDIKDTSTTLDYKETWTVVMEDTNRVRHTITVDIPKFYEDKFLYLGGNKKIIDKQQFLYPVVKTGPDTVQVVTNYNKAFIRRVDTRSISSIERFKSMIRKHDELNKYISYGSATEDNKGKMSTIEYDQLASLMVKFEIGNDVIFFNRKDAQNYTEIKKIDDSDPNKFFCGMVDKKPVYIDVNTQRTDDGSDIIGVMVSMLDDESKEYFNKSKSGTRLMYTNVTVMAQAIPLVTLLGYWEGLETILKKADIKFRFAEKNQYDAKTEASIKLAHGYLIYDNKVEAQILINGLNVIDLPKVTFSELNDKEIYIRYFTKRYGKSSITSALYNFYEFMIDPITLEILEAIDLPTDIVSLMLYANSLLVDNSYTQEVKQDLYRIRSNEVVAAILYSTIANNYITVRNSGGKKRMSIPRDAVIKQLIALQTVEDYSTLNPMVECGKSGNVSAKGWKGANVPEAYDEIKRSYDVSMLGMMAMSTSPDGNVGVMRGLVMEPTISSARGFIDHKYDDVDQLHDVNLFSTVELLTSNSATKDDSTRTAMATKQSKHLIPIKNSSPVLLSNGAEEAVRYQLSSDFVVNADNDGTVVEINEKLELMFVEYKDGTKRGIDLSSHIVKNGAGGFFLPNQLITTLKVGDKFKKDDLLAYHKDFFTQTKHMGTKMNLGALCKVCCMSSYNTYEDSNMITHKLSDDLITYMDFQKTVFVGNNSTVDHILSIGDTVEIGDILIQFDTSFGETEINKFLAGLSDEQQDVINTNAKTTIKSSYSGVIDDIKITSTVELDQLSPSLRKIVEKHYSKINAKKKLLEKYDSSGSVVKAGILFTDSTEKVTPNMYGVLKGEKVGDGVLFEFYIKYKDVMGVGDKGAMTAALKFVVGEIIPEGYEPYSEFRPDEEVGMSLSDNSIIKRMTYSVIPTAFGNKIVIELKRKLEEIYRS